MGTATAFPNDANVNWEKEGSTEEDMLAIQWQHEEDDMLAIQWQHEGLIVDDDQQQHPDTDNIVNSGNDAANTGQRTTSLRTGYISRTTLSLWGKAFDDGSMV